MRQNQTFTGYEELHRLALEAVRDSGKTQAAVAEDLGKSTGAVSRALKEPGSRFASLQKEIVEHLTPYRVEEELTFRLVKK